MNYTIVSDDGALHVRAIVNNAEEIQSLIGHLIAAKEKYYGSPALPAGAVPAVDTFRTYSGGGVLGAERTFTGQEGAQEAGRPPDDQGQR